MFRIFEDQNLYDSKILLSKNTIFQIFKDLISEDSKILGLKILRFEDLKNQRFEIMKLKIARFKNSTIQSFDVLIIRRFENSIFQRFLYVPSVSMFQRFKVLMFRS